MPYGICVGTVSPSLQKHLKGIKVYSLIYKKFTPFYLLFSTNFLERKFLCNVADSSLQLYLKWNKPHSNIFMRGYLIRISRNAVVEICQFLRFLKHEIWHLHCFSEKGIVMNRLLLLLNKKNLKLSELFIKDRLYA